MVPEDARRLLKGLEHLPLIARGAESEIRVGEFLGLKAVFKVRTPKPYMDPVLDRLLRRRRTLREAKVIAVARQGGVSAPRLYLVLPRHGLIVMEYVEGRLLKDAISGDEARGLAEEAGRQVGLLHSLGIVHGDPTTSNFIVASRGLVLIDYGLSDFSSSVEDRAVDVHLFRRSVEATHPSLAQLLLDGFLDGYRRVMGDKAKEVISRAAEIALRGRYVEERRKTVWGAGSR